MSTRSRLMRGQVGASAIETLLALLPILFTGCLCIELARGYQVRHVLTLSLQDAARIAAVHQAASEKWQPALRRALSTLFVPAGRFASPHLRQDAASQSIKQRFGLPLWEATQLASTPDTIHLKMIYLYCPMQEWLRRMLQAIYRMKDGPGNRWGQEYPLEQRARLQGLIPIVIEYRVHRHRSLGQH